MVTGIWYTHAPNFGSLFWIWRCKEHLCPLSPHLGLWRTLEGSDWGLAYWYWFGYGYWSLVHQYYKFWLSILILKVQRTSISFESSFGALDDAGWCDWGLASWYWFGYGHWSLIHPNFKFWLSILILKVQKTSMSFKSWFVALEDAGCSWLEFDILILIGYCHWSLIHPYSEFKFFSLYPDFECA